MAESLYQLTDADAQRVTAAGDGTTPDGLVPYSALQVEHVDWLIPGHVPEGMLTVLAGEQGLGKSLLHARWASDLSRRSLSSVLVSAEDSPTHTTKARLIAAQADEELVYHAALLPVLGNGSDAAWLERMHRWILGTDARLIVLDPLAAFISADADSYKDAHVRRILAQLDGMARTTGAAIVYIMHLTKGTGSNPLQRIQGSVAFTAAARSVLLMTPETDPASPNRIVAHIKCNVAEKAAPQRWEVEGILLSNLAGRDVRTARISYRGIAEGFDLSTLLGTHDPEEDGKFERACQIIEDMVTIQDIPSRELTEALREFGISERTSERARRHLGVEPVKKGSKWFVTLSQRKSAKSSPPNDDGGLEYPANDGLGGGRPPVMQDGGVHPSDVSQSAADEWEW